MINCVLENTVCSKVFTLLSTTGITPIVRFEWVLMMLQGYSATETYVESSDSYSEGVEFPKEMLEGAKEGMRKETKCNCCLTYTLSTHGTHCLTRSFRLEVNGK